MTTSALTGFTLSVDDLDAAAAWYGDSFGLTTAGRFGLEPYQLEGVVLGSDAGWTLELLHRTGSTGRDRVAHPLDAALLRGLAGVQVDVDDLDATLSRLETAGATVLMPAHPGPSGMSAFVADPEGNVIRLRDPHAPTPPPPPGAPGAPA
ncbi:MAG: VOC family protein [Microbacterium sp.]|uniref:VOC family protein n=1 Tax=Microbacterium sp. TaxID=51671 RepID=UPI0039E3F6F3